jgi:hypothetical protein
LPVLLEIFEFYIIEPAADFERVQRYRADKAVIFKGKGDFLRDG